MTLSDILKAKGNTVHTICPEASLEEVVEELARHNIGALVVCRRDLDIGECMVGIISERDILRFCATGKRSLAEAKVTEVMSTRVLTGSPQDPVEKIMGMMTNNRIRHLPVLTEGRLVGIVSIGDVVKSQLEQLALENQFMKHYITG